MVHSLGREEIMAKNASGYRVTDKDLPIILGMVARGDRNHNIAAWFGLNQGRIKGAKDGMYGTPAAAHQGKLPPKGPPGIKGRRLREASAQVLAALKKGSSGLQEATDRLTDAIKGYDADEA
jgi:hypothetical protein